MEWWIWVALASVAVVAVVAGLAVAIRARRARSRELRERFGPEYDRLVEEMGSRREAEKVLLRRLDRRRTLEVRPLRAEERERYGDLWRKAEAIFVDSPSAAVGQAQGLITDVMKDRGYQPEDFERKAADVSVDHPDVTGHYRRAHDIWMASQQGEVETEDLRLAMKLYERVFTDLLSEGTAATDERSPDRS
jgi:hypothetical protein